MSLQAALHVPTLFQVLRGPKCGTDVGKRACRS